MPRVRKDSTPIRDLDHWGEIAGPKSRDQWVPGRSALEAARYWLDAGDHFPEALSASFAAHPDFGTIADWSAEPEVRLPFDQFKGEPRNTDLLIRAFDEYGPFLIAVEAKADESFGALASDQLADAVDARMSNPRSMALARVEGLAKSILPVRSKGAPALRQIRYQLLTATAGAIAEASRNKVSRAVLLIQEFCSTLTKDTLQRRNHADLEAFVSRMSDGRVKNVVEGQVLGPFDTPISHAFSPRPELYVLKWRCDARGSLTKV
jgi:hypothetical protein